MVCDAMIETSFSSLKCLVIQIKLIESFPKKFCNLQTQSTISGRGVICYHILTASTKFFGNNRQYKHISGTNLQGVTISRDQRQYVGPTLLINDLLQTCQGLGTLVSKTTLRQPSLPSLVYIYAIFA